jgi:hypothetical protein
MYNSFATQATIAYYSLQRRRAFEPSTKARNANQIVATVTTYCNRFTIGCDSTYCNVLHTHGHKIICVAKIPPIATESANGCDNTSYCTQILPLRQKKWHNGQKLVVAVHQERHRESHPLQESWQVQ